MEPSEIVVWRQVEQFLARRLQQEQGRLARAPVGDVQVIQGRVQVLMELQQLRAAVTQQEV